jgi:hypothetical protein
MNELTPFKNRHLDYNRPVTVYRNIHKKGKVFSVKQLGRVIGHATQLTLIDCTFHVNKNGQALVRQTRTKNVHAWIRGKVSPDGCFGSDGSVSLPAQISYNPYIDDAFMVKNLTEHPFKVSEAAGVVINQRGVSAAYTNS